MAKDNESKKPKLKLKGVGSIEKAHKKKVIIYGVLVVLVMVVLVQTFVTGGDADKRQVVEAPEFVNTTPTPTSTTELTISRLQSKVETLKDKNKQQRRARENALSDLKEQLAKQKKAQTAQMKMLTDKFKKLKQTRDEKQVAEDDSASTNDKQTATQNPYLLPPLPGSNENKPAVVLPPTTRRAENTGNNNQVAQRTQTVPTKWTNLPQPLMLTGSGSGNGNNVLVGEKAKANKPKKEKGHFLPMGSFANAVLLTGADFGAGGTTRSNPQPVLLRITSNATLPNKSKYKLKGCFAMGSGYGDLSSERAYVSITRLSCTNPETGQVLEAPVIAYMVDSDGKLGMRGNLVHRQGAVMAKAIMAGFASGASELLSQQASGMQSTITGAGIVQTIDADNLGKAGLYKGSGKAMDMLAQRYMQEAKSIFPVIEINSSRKASIVFQNGVFLKWRVPGQKDQ